MEPFSYTTRGQTYEIKPFPALEPKTGDNSGLAFTVKTDDIMVAPTLRISGTVEAVWGLSTLQESYNAISELGKVKIPEEIEKGTELRGLDYMFISSDPVVADTLELTVANLKQELETVVSLNESRTYQTKKQEFNHLITNIFAAYDSMDASLKRRTGQSLFTTTISGVQNQILLKDVRTKDEYHWMLMLESLPFESMDFSNLDSSFPSTEEKRRFNSALGKIAGDKSEYVFIGTVSSLTQLEIIINRFDHPSRSHQVRTLKDVHGLRNSFPTHTNQRYKEHRKNLGLPDDPPENAGEDNCAYINELLIINHRLNDAVKVVDEKLRALTAKEPLPPLLTHT